MLSKKQLLIAASAAMTLGLGTTLGHEAVVHADTTNNTNTSSVTASSENNTQTNSSAATTNSSNSSTNSSNTTDNTTKTTNTTGSNTTSTNTGTTSTPATTSSTTDQLTTDTKTASVTTPTSTDTNTSTVVPTASTTAGSSSLSTGTETTPVNNDSTNNTSVTPVTATNSSTVPATGALTQATTTSTTTTNTATANQTTPTTTTATVAPVTETTTTTGMKPVDTSANSITSDSDHTDANDFTWSTDDDTGEAALTGTTNKLTDSSINIPTQITVTPNGTNTGKQYNVTSIGDNAFVGNKTVTSVQINSGVTNIGTGAFGYSNLQNVDLTNDNDLTTIGDLAFVSDQIKTVDLPDSVTSVGDNAFTYNNALTSVTMSANLATIGKQAFAEDTNLQNVDFSKDTALTTIADAAFSGDAKITGVDLSNSNKLTSIGNQAFMYNSASTEVKLPDSLQTIGDQAFLSNLALKNINFGSNLTTIGKEAFTYDGALTSADFSNANKLNLINDGAFEYSGLTGTLTIPSGVVTIGNQAFGGDHLTSLNLPEGLQSIGNNAFAYNEIGGTLTIPSTIQNVGSEAFIGNKLTGVSTTASDFSLGTGALSNNRITNISAPNVKVGSSAYNINSATNQLANIFTDSAHNNISDYFNVNIGGTTEDALGISDLTNGVTYNNGIFTIPSGVNDFTFNWLLSPNPTTDQGYSGTYDVVLDNPDIKVVNSNVAAGSSWTPSDNFVSAVTPDGSDVSLNNMNVSITNPDGQAVTTIDTTDPGTYKVTYSYGNESSTVNVAVYKRAGNIDLSGNDSTTYNGQDQTFNNADYQITLSNGSTYTIQSGDLALNTPAKNAGTYQVVLTPQGLNNIGQQVNNTLYNWTVQNNDAEFVIDKAPITITANDVSKVAGTTDPNLSATVTMPNITDGDTPIYTLSRTPGEDVGTYPITVGYNATDNPNYDIQAVNGNLQITAAAKTISGSNYVMHAGDPTPTAKDFNATATDENDQPEIVNVDLNNANLKANGTYTVTLSTSDGQTKNVELTVVGATTNAGSETPIDPTDPTTSTDPIDPTDPTTSTDPTDPKNPTKPIDTTKPTTPSKPVVPEVPTTSNKPSKPVISDNPTNIDKTASNFGKQVIMSGEVYYIPGVNSQTNGVLVTPKNMSNKMRNGYQPTYQQAGVATFPQTGNENGIWMQILGAIVAVLTFGVIDINKKRHQAK